MPVDTRKQIAVLVQQVETAVSVHQSAHAVEHAVFLVAGANACGSETDAVLQRADARLGVGSVGLGCVRRGLRGLGLGFGCELHVQAVVVLGDFRRDFLRDTGFRRIRAGDSAGDAGLRGRDVRLRGKPGTVRTLIVLHDTQGHALGRLVDIRPCAERVVGEVLRGARRGLRVLYPRATAIRPILPRLVVTMQRVMAIPVRPWQVRPDVAGGRAERHDLDLHVVRVADAVHAHAERAIGGR